MPIQCAPRGQDGTRSDDQLVRQPHLSLDGVLDLFNGDTILSSAGRFSPTRVRLPIQIMGGRLFKFGAQLNC